MDQPIDPTPPETLDDIMDAVTRDSTHRVIDRGEKEPVIIMSIPEFWRLKLGPAPEWLQHSWAIARETGLDKMTMDEIDEEIRAAREERKNAEATKR